MRLSGKRAFITAAGQGIGRASAEAFLREGATVIASDLNADLLKGLDCETIALDVTDEAALTEAVTKAAPDVLFNCAGVVHAGSILEMKDSEWDFAFKLNVRAQHVAIKAALPGMIERGAGRIINMASVAGSVMGVPNRYIYGVTKAAVIGLTKAVAKDFVLKGIRCNAICPGTVDSPSLHQRLKATGDYEGALKQFIARQPMGRLGKAEEIAALAVFLALPESDYMNGQAVIMDGGMAG
jgi:2-keto-3-deoxy-L-fuconate dehydrogenase